MRWRVQFIKVSKVLMGVMDLDFDKNPCQFDSANIPKILSKIA